MLIKEYRIPMPLTVEEYRIAQLYMINKKSLQETEGAGSGVEIRKNEPYTNGPNGTNGQYTEKIYYVANHIPGWMSKFMSQATLDSLTVNEVAWNAYPYAKTIQTVSVMENFSMEIESHYLPDCGTTDNLFSEVSRSHPVELVDFVAPDVTDGSLGKNDPKTFVSEKKQRGPLATDWLEKGQRDSKNGQYMCSYKLVKVNFRVWGIQNRVERFIHDSVITKMLCEAHQQAWCWMDEWADYSMADIRREEKITMKKLYELYHGKQDDSSDDSDSDCGEDQMQDTITDADKPPLLDCTLTAPNSSASDDAFDESHHVQSYGDSDEFHSALDELSMASSDPNLEQLSMTCPPGFWQQARRESPNLRNPERRRTPRGSRRSSLIKKAYRRSVSDEINTLSNDGSPNLSKLRLPKSAGKRTTDTGHDIHSQDRPSSSLRKSSADPTKYLILVLLTESNGSGEDFNDFKRKCFNFFPAMHSCYTQIRLIEVPFEFNDPETNLLDSVTWMNDFRFLNKNFALTIGMTQRKEYQKLIRYCAQCCNEVYKDVRQRVASSEGWKVIIIADDYSGIVAYDTLQTVHQTNMERLERQRDSFRNSSSDMNVGETQWASSPTSLPDKLARNSSILTSRPLQSEPLSHNRSDDFSHRVGFNAAGSFKNDQLMLHFEPEKLVLLGSSLGKVLAFRKIKDVKYSPEFLPPSTRIINIFHETDPLASRLEPVLRPTQPLHRPLKMRNYNRLSGRDSIDPHRKSHNHRIDIVFCPKDQLKAHQMTIALLPYYLHDALWESDEVIKFIFSNLLEIPGLDNQKIISQQPQNSAHPYQTQRSAPTRAQLRSPTLELQNKSMAALSPNSSDDEVTRRPVSFVEMRRKSQKMSINKNEEKRRRKSTAMQSISRRLRNRFASSSSHDDGSARGFTRHISTEDHEEELQPNRHTVTGGKAVRPQFNMSSTLPMSTTNLANSSTSFTRDQQVPALSASTGDLNQGSRRVPQWRKFRSKLLISGSVPNHRCQDIIFMNDYSKNCPDIFAARFSYGILGQVKLVGEIVDLYLYLDDEWKLIKPTQLTDSEARVRLSLDDETLAPVNLKKPGRIIPFKWQVRVDRSYAIGYLWSVGHHIEKNLPRAMPATRSVIFSIDGSFAGSKSMSGLDPRVRPGAVDLVRFWKDRHYLPVYITARLDIQKSNVEQWLTKHNFPHGPIIFCGIMPQVKNYYLEPMQEKLRTLEQIRKKLVVVAAYGSEKDKDMYVKMAGADMKYICIYNKGDTGSGSGGGQAQNSPRMAASFKDIRLIQVNDYIQHIGFMESVLPNADASTAKIDELHRLLISPYGFASNWKSDS